jgi:hypothetical protein
MTHKVREKYENVQFNHDIWGCGIRHRLTFALVVVICSVMSFVWSELPTHFRHVDEAVTL